MRLRRASHAAGLVALAAMLFGWRLAHCRRADQTFDKPQVKVPEFQAAMVRSAGEPPRSPGLASLRVPVATGPPRRILFQSFLI